MIGAKDKTVVVINGRLDAHRLAGILAIVEGKAHARPRYNPATI